ncbi:MAG: hypothetical protein QOE70_5903 [Chthoniobacter sp.]|jgi:hypothetical protein|nr:hypothetical protein [Chthoniobacter sp.]
MPRSAVLVALLTFSAAALADGPNVVVNGDFAKFAPQENLWDGVDAQNFLAGNRQGTYALTESGKVGNLEMPVSVSFVDMNGDKLPDLVTADGAGIVRAYINGGSKTEPKFTHAEIIPIYPPRVARDEKWERSGWTWHHGTPKLTVFDWNRRGTPDLIFGNYTGDVLKLPNTGSAMAPAFEQPSQYAKVRIDISAKRPWGNLFAPCAVDWNKDGKPDLLLGEGSYSANAVFLLLNQSGSSEPKFSEEQRYYLCYGDGREQLVPTIADWNGDGLPDVLVGDRKGTVGVHLNQGNWKPDDELPLAAMVSFGGTQDFGGPIAPHAADFNGDGLFDLIVGKANGRIALAINKGTPAEPKFDAPVELKGTNLWADNIRIPATWTIDPGHTRANLYSYISVTDEAGPGGGKVLKAGYFPSPNKVFKMGELTLEGRDDDDFFRYWLDQWVPIPATWAGADGAVNSFVIRQTLPPLQVGATYHLSFKTKGRGIHEGRCTVAYLGANENTASKFVKAGRGVKVEKDETKEEVKETEAFPSNMNWKAVEKTFTIQFKEKNIKKLETTTLAILEFKFELEQYLGECEICDVVLAVKGK